MPTWNSPFNKTDPRNGQEVTVLARRKVPSISGHGPDWDHLTVQFPDGFVSDAWPEEIGEVQGA